MVYHILNRPNARITLLEKDEDYAAFERVLEEAHEAEPLPGDVSTVLKHGETWMRCFRASVGRTRMGRRHDANK